MRGTFQAYASRSELVSVFRLGLFSNPMMNKAVGLSLFMLPCGYISGVNSVFDNVALAPLAWVVIIPLALIPFAASECYKAYKNSLHK